MLCIYYAPLFSSRHIPKAHLITLMLNRSVHTTALATDQPADWMGPKTDRYLRVSRGEDVYDCEDRNGMVALKGR